MIFRTVSPTRVLRVGVCINSVQEEQQDLQCILTTSAICVLDDVSIHLDIATLEFKEMFEHPPFLPGTPILRQLLVRHNRVVEQ